MDLRYSGAALHRGEAAGLTTTEPVCEHNVTTFNVRQRQEQDKRSSSSACDDAMPRETKRQHHKTGNRVLREYVAVPDEDKMDQPENEQGQQSSNKQNSPITSSRQILELDFETHAEQKGKKREAP